MTQHADTSASATEHYNDAGQLDNEEVLRENSMHEADDATASSPQKDSRRKSPENGSDRISELSLALQADLARTAAALEAGEFSLSGSGHPGSLFRAIHSLDVDSPEHTEAWSVLLEVAETIWGAEHYQASLAFVKAAHLYLNTPVIFEERVVSAIEFAENAILVQRAEARFAEGDVDGAIGLARQLKGQDRDAYVEEIGLRQKGRRRSRKVAFIFAGITIIGLMSVSIAGVVQMRNFFRDPPSISLPEFPRTGLIEDLKNSRLIEGELPDVSEILEKLREESAESAPAATPSDRDDPASASPRVPSPEVEAPQDPEETLQVEALLEPQVADPAPATLPDPRPAKAPTAEAIYNCALGQAVSKRAIEIVMASGSQAKAGPVEAFVTKVNAACAALSTTQAELDTVAEQIPAAQIETIARNIAP